MRKDEEPIVVEATYAVPVDEVWRAITNLDAMRRWFFPNIPAFEPRVGFETRFDVESGGRVFPHVWRITEVTPGRRITYNWRYEGYAGDSTVTFELFLVETGSGVRLRLTHQANEDFPEDIPEFARESGVEGWTFFIRQSLKYFLEGQGGE